MQRPLNLFVASALASALAAPAAAQSPSALAASTPPDAVAPSAPGLFEALASQPAGPPPTPRHTGVKTMMKDLYEDVKHVPSLENLYWAGLGGGLALAVHPADDNLQEALVGDTTAERIFKPGAVLGQLYTLLPVATGVYIIGRAKDQPKTSHM